MSCCDMYAVGAANLGCKHAKYSRLFEMLGGKEGAFDELLTVICVHVK